MLRALLEDCAAVAGVALTTLLADAMPVSVPAHCLRTGSDEQTGFQQLAAAANCTVIIAPESDDILATRCQWVEQVGGRSAGCSPAVINLTADKLALAQHWHDRHVPTVPAILLDDCNHARHSVTFPAVCKPRDGAGSQATFLIRNGHELKRSLHAARAEGVGQGLLLQRFVPGRPASVAFLLGPNQCVPLLPAEQRLSADGRFRYLGGLIPLAPQLTVRAVALAQKAVAAVPGLQGYVGVDLILGDAADGSEDVAIEINPRLTTSYIGLRQLARGNLAEAWLRVLSGEPVKLSWQESAVQFQADGRVEPCY
jgi:predicted ATP-grasp superfamily ATP-dependent carboligase